MTFVYLKRRRQHPDGSKREGYYGNDFADWDCNKDTGGRNFEHTMDLQGLARRYKEILSDLQYCRQVHASGPLLGRVFETMLEQSGRK
jgi:hypothetical protein